MRRLSALCLLGALAAPVARAEDTDDPAAIPPTAHASPSGPAPQAFDRHQLPPGHPAVNQVPPGHPPVADETMDAKQLLEKLDSMKDELKNRPKTAEIEYALGNLYYENGRYPDAIDEYRHLLERAKAPLARYLEARKHPHKTLTPEQAGCPEASHPSYEQLIAIADSKAGAGDYSAAVTCYEGALLPIVVAKARRANAFFLIGNPDRAAQEHREVLAIEPEFSDSLFFLGAILYETGDGDLAKLQQAADAWKRYLATGPDPDRAKMVKENLAKLDVALRNGGHLPLDPVAAPRGPMMGMGAGPIEGPAPAPDLTAKERRELAAAIGEGQRLLDKRDWAGALGAFDRARKIDRADPDAATGAGIALLNLGQRVDAEAAFRDALGRDPAHGLALYELGEVFFENEHYAGAARFWGQLQQSDPKLAAKVGLDKRLADAQARAQ
jgi:tetratricopeptide (TPR) repeat protein